MDVNDIGARQDRERGARGAGSAYSAMLLVAASAFYLALELESCGWPKLGQQQDDIAASECRGEGASAALRVLVQALTQTL